MGRGTSRRNRHLGRSDREPAPHLRQISGSLVYERISRTLGSSVHDDLWCEAKEDMLEEADGKSEACPVMLVLHDVQAVAVELDLAIEVLLLERLEGNLVPAAVLDPVLLALEGKVVLDWSAGKLGLLVLAGSERRCQSPECEEDGDGGEQGEEEGSLQATANLP